MFHGKQLRALQARIVSLELRIAQLTVGLAEALECTRQQAFALGCLGEYVKAQQEALPGEFGRAERRAH